MSKFWKALFLKQRSSLGLSFFRICLAFSVAVYVFPLILHLKNIFPVAVFSIFWFTFLIGFFSQISCIIMTICCYYFFALNHAHVVILSWDILLGALVLMCVTDFHGDYFSIDVLIRGDLDGWRRDRPFFIQRLLQFQMLSTFLFLALDKTMNHVNWIKNDPVFLFLFFAQMLLFIQPARISEWVEVNRRINEGRPRPKVIYDGACGFCRSSVRLLQVMDLWGNIDTTSGPKNLNEMRLDMPDGRTYGGFFAFRQLVWLLPMLYVMIPIVYFPGAGIIGPKLYSWFSRNRYLISTFHASSKEQCHL